MTAISVITYVMVALCGLGLGWLTCGIKKTKTHSPEFLLFAFIIIVMVAVLVGALVVGVVSTDNDFNVQTLKTSSAKCLSQNGVYDAETNTCWRNGEQL